VPPPSVIANVGGPQISSANPQICGLKICLSFADLPQIRQFEDLLFADPIIFGGLKNFRKSSNTYFSPNQYKIKMLSFKFKDNFWFLG
jgi:hypothetical protein